MADLTAQILFRKLPLANDLHNGLHCAVLTEAMSILETVERDEMLDAKILHAKRALILS